MAQDELDAHLASVDEASADAMLTLTKVATHTVVTRRTLIEGLTRILAILNGSNEDQAVTLEIKPGTPREQP